MGAKRKETDDSLSVASKTKKQRLNTIQRLEKVATLGNGLEIRPSYGGVGIFAQREFSAGEWVALFDGIRINQEEADRLRAQEKHLHVITIVPKHEYIDGWKADKKLRPGMHVASLSNDANWSPEGYSRVNRNNCKYFDAYVGHLKIAGIKATKTILPGEEITWSYMNNPTQNVN